MIDVVCAVIIENNGILIVQNGPETSHPYLWEFPGGKVESGEGRENALVREISEELDICVRPVAELKSVEDGRICLIPFICIPTFGELKLHEHIEYRWTNLEKLGDYSLSPADRLLFEDAQNQQRLKEYIGEKKNQP